MVRSLAIALVLAIPTSLAAAPSTHRGQELTEARVHALGFHHLDSRFLNAEPPDADLLVSRLEIDELRLGHLRVQQTFAGVPVFEGEAIVHLRPDGTLFSMTDNLVRGVDLDTVPTLSREDAVALAMIEDDREGDYTAEPEVDLQIFARGEPKLTWRVQLRMEDGSEHTAMPVFFIDAHTGETVFKYDNLQTGSGVSLYSGKVTVTTYKKSSSSFYLEDHGRKLGTFDMRNGTSKVYQMVDSNDVWDSSTQKAAVDAHLGAWMVYDYFKNTFGRNGIDGNGGPAAYYGADGKTPLIASRVHYGRRYNNAYWDGTKMTYGDGDGSQFGPLVSIDIAGHEMTHGITQYSAKLTYQGESGALNESMSDVFGALIEFYTYGEGTNGGNWWIGEDAFTPAKSGDALRYMDDPHKANNYGYTADDDPDHYSERYTGTGDNGGVHINSGIANKVFYLLAQGGTHHLGGSMTGIGRQAAGAIWYKALTSFMTASTNFAQARAATLDAAAALYGAGSAQQNAVAQAWSLCGVN